MSMAQKTMALKTVGIIEIPDAEGSEFDHGAFDPATRRIFVAHTGRDRIEVIDHDAGKHIATLPGFPEAAGVVADDGAVLVTNRGAASLAWLDARSLETRAVFKTGPRPNGVAIVPQQGLAIVASIGDDHNGAKLEVFSRDGRHHALDLPGRPRWCVTDAAAKRVFLAIRDPSMIFVASLPDLGEVEHWRLPCGGAHGVDIDHQGNRLYVAGDDGAPVEVDIGSGAGSGQLPSAEIGCNVLQSDHRSGARGHRQSKHRCDHRSAHRRQQSHHPLSAPTPPHWSRPDWLWVFRRRIAAP